MFSFAGDVKVYSHSRGWTLVRVNGEHGKEEWLKLCEQAAVERDPERLMLLTREICRLLEEREKALKNGKRL